MAKLEVEFKRAGKDGGPFRGAPFWSWNDDLQPEELRRQVWEMKSGGMGGHFMHARPGLITPYLGRKWMECIRATVEESKKAGVAAWLYDEDCWPSGPAGGRVQALGREYWAKRITLKESSPASFRAVGETLAVFLARKENGRLENVRRVSEKEAKHRAEKGDSVFHFAASRDASYVDLLSAEVTDAFLRLGYDPYNRQVEEEYGRTIPGIFTDEPNYQCVPWTEGLPAAFSAHWGYDISDHLLGLFYEIGEWQQTRHDFWHTATNLFVNNFTRRLYEWCERQGLALTGHMLCEDSLGSQVHWIGAAMPHYRWMQSPGVDHLCRRITDPLLNKQVSSVAHQLGRRRVLSESFGCSGWNMSFEDMKWIWDWQAVQGVNFLCQHLSLYSLKGLRKRDYPPSIFYQQPWWRDYRLFNDYVARLGAALTSGRPTADLLVIHPIESAWAVFHPQQREKVEALNHSLVNLSHALLGNQRDFDFGDESLLAEFGKAEDGRLRLGECTYAVVIVPPGITLRTTTVNLLSRFLSGGGKVVFVGEIPRRVDGRASARIREELLPEASVIAEGEVNGLLRLLNRWLPRPFSLRTRPAARRNNIYSCERALEEGRRMWFFANLDRHKGAAATLNILGSGSLQEWDLQSGEIRDLPVAKADSGLQTKLGFERAGSRLLVFDPKGKPRLHRRRVSKKIVRRQRLSNIWQVRRTEPNVLTLDYCQYRIGEQRWSKTLPTIRVNEIVRGLKAGTPLGIRFTFQADCDLSKGQDMFLLLERPQLYRLRVNGKPVANRERGWWCDIAFRKVKISEALKKGENVVELSTRIPAAREAKFLSYGGAGGGAGARTPKGLEVESCYLIGEFDVSKVKAASDVSPARFALRPPARSVKVGDLGPQGMPFYRGAVIYSREIESQLARGERAWLEFSGLEGIVFKVRVNGKKAGTLVWQPWRVEITDLLQKGKNRLEVEVIGSCRNMLGPHHHPQGELFAVSPASFRGQSVWAGGEEKIQWRPDCCFVPFGITGPVRIIYTKRA